MSLSDLSRRQRLALTLLGVVLGAAILPATGAVSALLVDFSSPTPQSGTYYYEMNSGAEVAIQGDYNVSSGDPFVNDTAVTVETEDAGNVTVVAGSNGHANMTVTQLTGTYTKVEAINVTGPNATINPSDKTAVTVQGDTEALQFRSMQADDAVVDFIYNGSSGYTELTVRGLAASTQFRAVDADSGNVLDIGTTDGSGALTLNMSNSQHKVSLQSGAANPILENPVPDGNVSTQPSEFAVDVSDDDFPGDTVTVEFYYEQSKIDTKSVTSDGTVKTTNVPTVDSGVHEWSVVATDTNGNKDIVNATVGTPGQLTIRNETNASQLVDSPINVTVAFKNGTTVTTRTTDDGTIDMTGLPTTDFIVTAEASSDYYKRVEYFESIIGNQSIYMLNKSYAATESRFELSDPTGEYPPSSVLILKKAINQSGTNKYRTIYSDRFGVEGVTADLQKDERYLVSIRAPDGTVQQIGPYRADVSETVTVRPGSPTIEWQYNEEGWASNASLSNRTLSFGYSDPQQETQQVTVWVHEKGNQSNRLRANVSYYDLGNFTGTYTLTKNESQKTWVVNFIVDRNSDDFTSSDEVANNPDLVPDLASEWRLIIGVGALMISAGVFSILNASVGGVVVALEGGVLWWAGWLEGATSGAAVVLALFIAIIVHIMKSGRPG